MAFFLLPKEPKENEIKVSFVVLYKAGTMDYYPNEIKTDKGTSFGNAF